MNFTAMLILIELTPHCAMTLGAAIISKEKIILEFEPLYQVCVYHDFKQMGEAAETG